LLLAGPLRHPAPLSYLFLLIGIDHEESIMAFRDDLGEKGV